MNSVACRHTRALVLVLAFTTAKTGYMALIQGVSQQEATRLVVLLATELPALSTQLHWPPQCSGVLIYGLAKPMR